MTDANETILLVEDDAAVRMMLTNALQHEGYEVLPARNGEDALIAACVHSAPVHLVLTDVVMPKVNGRELFAQLHRWYPRMRVLFMSGYARGALSADELEAGVTDFVAKPFRIEDMLARVRNMLDGRLAELN